MKRKILHIHVFVLPFKAPPTSVFLLKNILCNVPRDDYVINPNVRTNMAASMASRAAVRGLRTATSKHILLGKLKVLLEFTLHRTGVPCYLIRL